MNGSSNGDGNLRMGRSFNFNMEKRNIVMMCTEGEIQINVFMWRGIRQSAKETSTFFHGYVLSQKPVLNEFQMASEFWLTGNRMIRRA
jgi:hypothetical protein